ncbi:hypothetical protein P886_1295 [Alteromonadaceae bacterium 2753L.S.0a.02]|nr:hypothetical protein P886_1295 [Alteromonadaceae bacterium 2753L.S.0a.02]
MNSKKIARTGSFFRRYICALMSSKDVPQHGVHTFGSSTRKRKSYSGACATDAGFIG